MMCKLEAKLPGIELNKCNGSTVFTNFVLLKWPFLDFSVTILNNFKKVRIFFPFIFFTINLALFLPRNLLFLVKSIYLISYVYNVFTNFFNTFIKIPLCIYLFYFRRKFSRRFFQSNWRKQTIAINAGRKRSANSFARI